MYMLNFDIFPSSVKRRGMFLSLGSVVLNFGILVIYCLGAFFPWRLVSSLPPLLYILFFIALWRVDDQLQPPRVHRRSQEDSEGINISVMRYRCVREREEAEIIQLEEPEEQPSDGLTMTEAVRNLSRREVRTPFLLVTTNFFLVTFSGSHAIIYYSVEIFQSNKVAGLNKHLASIIVAAILVVGGTLGIFLARKQPRVRLSMIMMTLKSVCMGVLGGALYMTTLSEYRLNIIKVASVTAYMLCSSAGQFAPCSMIQI